MISDTCYVNDGYSIREMNKIDVLNQMKEHYKIDYKGFVLEIKPHHYGPIHYYTGYIVGFPNGININHETICDEMGDKLYEPHGGFTWAHFGFDCCHIKDFVRLENDKLSDTELWIEKKYGNDIKKTFKTNKFVERELKRIVDSILNYKNYS